jgi:hypothetical protein
MSLPGSTPVFTPRGLCRDNLLPSFLRVKRLLSTFYVGEERGLIIPTVDGCSGEIYKKWRASMMSDGPARSSVGDRRTRDLELSRSRD